MDAFSELLQIIRLNVCVYHNAMVCGNWRINETELGVTCFHMVTIGTCKLDVPGHLNKILAVGDLVIFPKEIAHSMEPLSAFQGPQRHTTYCDMSASEGTGMLCGAVRFQHRASNQLLAALPPVFIISNDEACDWLKPIVGLIVNESLKNDAAANVIIDRLAELLFMHALRHFIVTNPDQLGVMALYKHPKLSLAINAFHKQPSNVWTLDSLAKCAAQSRTQFAKKFREVSGWTPMEYVTWWRMQLAWAYLQQGDSVAITAGKIGYQSESSFLRAFKTTFDISAGQVRRMGHPG
jgi:AraC family transcriptional regulator, activator of mtrCDE